MMRIPFVIDNGSDDKRMSTVLNNILSNFEGHSLDVATAYFNVQGYQLVKDGLSRLGSFRLLLGFEPLSGKDVGLNPDKKLLLKKMRGDLENLPFTEEMLLLVEDLIRFLRQGENVDVRLYDNGFLHAKAYLFYNDIQSVSETWDRYQPYIGIVGSSNLTRGGLHSNKELNLVHKAALTGEDIEKVLQTSSKIAGSRWNDRIELDNTSKTLMSSVGATAIDELSMWYEAHWQDARPFKEDFIELLDTSKFGEFEYTPYHVYMKALYTYMKDDLDSGLESYNKSVIELTEFQEDAVKKARKILLKYNGVLLGDSVGLGKTWIGKKLLEDYAYHMRLKALVITPASLQEMWKKELTEESISANYLSQEMLGRSEFDPTEYGDVDVILIDESHNFRNSESARYASLQRIISMNGGRGKNGDRKIAILLTATPINNNLFDLYSQLSLITQDQKDYFAAAGIGDLRKYFLQARRFAIDGGSTIPIFNLLEEIVIRRSRSFIRNAYPEATVNGKKISWPDRKLKTFTYSLEDSYTGIYRDIVRKIEGLRLAPYSLESYKKIGIDHMEKGREAALVAIFKTRFLKRFESSVHAFRISIRRSLQFLKTFEDYLLDGKLLDSSNFRSLVRITDAEGEDDDSTPPSLADEFDSNVEAKKILERLPTLDITTYELRDIHEAISNDREALEYIWDKIKDISPDKDSKLQTLKKYLATEFREKKLLIFSYYKDTEKYLYNYFTSDEGKDFLKSIGNPTISRLDSDYSPRDRRHRIQLFSPVANNKPDLAGSEEEIDIMFSTDVLSEGQNLQDCGHLVNYDLHWNPTRMVQRAGRIDRIGTEYPVLHLYNFFPEDKLDELLRLVERLNYKIQNIDSAGFHDASILGEVPHPRNFNTLRRIRDEDGTVFEEEEQFIELASNETLKRILIDMLQKDGAEKIEEIPDGIHSGRRFERANGMFFYFTLDKNDGIKQHFWKYYDLNTNKIIDNRFIIANRIACNPDEPRVIPMGYDVFKIQDEIKRDILRDIGDVRSLEEAPRKIETEQQTIITILQEYLNHPGINRQELLTILRSLERPLAKVYVKKMRVAYKSYIEDLNFEELLSELKSIVSEVGEVPKKERIIQTIENNRDEDLSLVCFEYIS